VTWNGWQQTRNRLSLHTPTLFACVALIALFSVPDLNWELAVRRWNEAGAAISLLAAMTITWAAYRLRARISGCAECFGARLANIPAHRWLLLCVIAGVLIRLVWAVTFPAPQTSDNATYCHLAEKLLRERAYGGSTAGYAFWPPGYPFFLYVAFLGFDARPWVPLVMNLLLFAGTVSVIYQLTLRLTGKAAACVAALVVTFWPTYVTSSGLASKEVLLACLIPTVILIWFWSTTEGQRPHGWLAFLAGAVLGYIALVQPSFLLLPVLLIFYEWRKAGPRRWWGLKSGLLVLGMFCAIGPWTYRNWKVLHAFVPVSTNGGGVFYRSNNPLATGGYMPQGVYSFEGVDEVQAGRLAFQQGERWVVAHPGLFVRLAVRKEILFLGDDAEGVYETLKRGLGISGLRYIILKGVCNAFWWGLWILLLLTALVRRRFSERSETKLLMLTFLYLFVVHSVFESGARYHEPVLGILAVVAGALADPHG